MPCNSSHLSPSLHEVESVKVRGFLREVGLPVTGRDDVCYGNVKSLDADMAALCKWCRNHDVSRQSLELQIWWRDHRKADFEKSDKSQEEFVDIVKRLAYGFPGVTEIRVTKQFMDEMMEHWDRTCNPSREDVSQLSWMRIHGIVILVGGVVK